MRVLGLTGGMGAGKTTVAALFRQAGWPVFDSDVVVHRLQGRGGDAVGPLGGLWPEVVRDGSIDRAALRRRVIGDPPALRRLEGIIHPLVRRERGRFDQYWRRRGQRWVLHDIPLLFETGAQRDCDLVVVVTAPASLRLQRVMARRSVTAAQAHALIARQMGEGERLRRADLVIRNGLSRADTRRQVTLLRRRLEAMS